MQFSGCVTNSSHLHAMEANKQQQHTNLTLSTLCLTSTHLPSASLDERVSPESILISPFTSKSSCSKLLAIAPTCSDPFWPLHPATSFSFYHFWGFQFSRSSEPSPNPLFMQPFLHCPARHTCFPCVPRLLGLALALYHFPSCVLMICDHSSSPLVKCKAPEGWGSALSNCTFPSRISSVLREIFVRQRNE